MFKILLPFFVFSSFTYFGMFLFHCGDFLIE